MHRSGTSCLAGMLQSAGFHTGSLDVWTPDNNRGNRENKAIVQLNDSILLHGGGSWSKPFFSLSPTIEHIRNRDRLVQEFLEAEQPWMFKDPRTLLTLPFWLEALKSASLLGIFRHPLAVANSLSVRNSMPLQDGLLLWQSYNELLLKVVDSNDVPLLHFSQNVAGLTEAATRVLAAEFSAEIESGIIQPERMQDFITSDLVHQVQPSDLTSLEYSLNQAGISGKQADVIIELWDTLVGQAVNPPDTVNEKASSAVRISDSINDYVEKGQFRKALDMLEATLATNQKRTDLWQQGISIIKQAGNPRLLSKWVKRSLEANPDYPGFLFEQAKLTWQTGNQKEALRMVEKVVSLTPGWEPAIKLLSNWYYERQEWQKAADLLLELSASRQGETETLNFAQIFVDGGRGFNEEDSIREPVIVNGQKTELLFDLSRFKTIKAIRFDPLNDFTVVRLDRVTAVDKNGNKSQIGCKSSNAQLLTEEIFNFSTKDPQITLKVTPSTHHHRSELRVSLQYIHVGTSALLHCLELLKDQHQRITDPTDSGSSKLTTGSRPSLSGEIAEILKGWELDSSDKADVDDTEVLLQGWAIPVKNDKLNIVIQYDGLTRSYDCNVSRPDIVKQFTESNRSKNINSTCGFCYKVPKRSKIKVGVEADMRIYWIETIHT